MSDDVSVGKPWEKYAAPPPAPDAKPWEKYGKEAKPVYDKENDPLLIDRTSGASSSLAKYFLAGADNPDEAKAGLDLLYGPKNVRSWKQEKQDPRWQVKEKDTWKDVFPQTFYGSAQRVAYDMAAAAPEIAGAMTGGAIGAKATSGLGPKGMIGGALIGAGTGTVAGKALDDLRKNAIGIYKKMPAEEAAQMNRDALWMMAFDTLGPTSKAALKPLWNSLRTSLTEVTPEIEKAAQKAYDIGGAPTMNAAPGMKISQAHENFFQQLGIRSKYVKNMQAITSLLMNKLKEAGVDDPSSVLEHMKGGNTPLPADVSEKAEKALTEVQSDLEKNQNAALQKAEDMKKKQLEANDMEYQKAKEATQGHIDSELAAIDRSIGKSGSVPLAKVASDRIINSRVEMSKAFEQRYGALDTKTGGAAIVPTDSLRVAGQTLKDKLLQLMGQEPEEFVVFDETPQGAKSSLEAAQAKAVKEKEVFAKAPLELQPLIQTVKELEKLPPNMPLMQAQRLRSQLIKLSEPRNLTPGTLEHEFGQLRNAADEAFDAAEKSPHGQSVKELRATNSDYRDAISKYKNRTVNKIVADAKSGIYPDDTVFVNSIIKDGQSHLINSLKSLMGPEKWQGVQKAYWDSLMTPPSGLPVMPNDLLFENLASNSGRSAREAVFGKQLADQMALAGRKASQLSPRIRNKFPLNNLPPGQFVTAVRRLNELQEQRNAFLKKNYIQELAKTAYTPTGKEASYNELTSILSNKRGDVIDWLTEGDKSRQIQAAYDLFGRDSEIGKGIKNAAAIKIVGAVARKIGSIAEKETASGLGAAMRGELEKLGASRKLLFTDSEYEDMLLTSKAFDAMLEKTSNVGGSMASGMAKLHIIVAAPLIALGKVQSKLTFDNSMFLRAVFNVQKNPSSANVAVLKKAMSNFKNTAIQAGIIQSGKRNAPQN